MSEGIRNPSQLICLFVFLLGYLLENHLLELGLYHLVGLYILMESIIFHLVCPLQLAAN